MPIYEYRCAECGFQKEYIRKMSDAPLTACPECGQETFAKLLSVAGFQLKGSGWYQSDFKGGSTAKEAPPVPACGTGACGAGGCGGGN